MTNTEIITSVHILLVMHKRDLQIMNLISESLLLQIFKICLTDQWTETLTLNTEKIKLSW